MGPIGNREESSAAWRSSRQRVSAPSTMLPRGWRAVPAAGGRCVTDEYGIGWRAHEIVSEAADGGRRSIGLLFCCDVPGIIPEVRRVWRPLGRLTDADLLDALQRAD